MSYNKYKNVKTGIDGHQFPSIREAKRYLKLKELKNQGIIDDLELQVPFQLAEGRPWKKPFMKKGRLQKRMRECVYIADFRYRIVATGEIVVEDAKGMETEAYKIKKKWVFDKYGIQIMEV